MPSDLALLEAAAKAAGIDLIPYTWDKGAPWGEHQGFTVAGQGPNEWNPLEDNDAAFSLLVKLCIRIYPPEPHLHSDRASCNVYGRGWWAADGDDPERATRRAIVLAAAALSPAALPDPSPASTDSARTS